MVVNIRGNHYYKQGHNKKNAVIVLQMMTRYVLFIYENQMHYLAVATLKLRHPKTISFQNVG